MGDFQHAGTSKAMPALAEEVVPVADAPTEPVLLPRTRTSEEEGEVAGEIGGDVTDKMRWPSGADAIAAERGVRPIKKPPIE